MSASAAACCAQALRALQTEAATAHAPASAPDAPYTLDTAFIPWANQGALLAELARSRGWDGDEWLLRAGVQAGQALSPRQLLALLAPLQRQAKDSAFVLGQLSLPGHFGLASQALSQAGNLLQALEVLCRCAARLSPLLTPRLLLREAADELVLVWTEACGSPAVLRPFLVDMQMSAVVALARWRGGQTLPWRFHFNRTQPADLSQHATYLGPSLQFDCQVNAMRLPLARARAPWPQASPPAWCAATALAQGAEPDALRRPLLAALHDHLLPRLALPPTLVDCATAFGISPATLKRHLAQHGTHFQAELDSVRTHVALYLLSLQGHSGEAVAQALGFFDATNFRRSFKRWTGGTPYSLGLA